ncbi:profilin-3-like [Aplochiton taeniatus]
MAEWRDYIRVALKDRIVEDVAIVGLYDNRAVWAAKPGGFLAAISHTEIEFLTGKERGRILQTGVTVGGHKAAVIRDQMEGPDSEIHFIDLRTKDKEGLSLTVGQTSKTLVFLMGKRGVHGGIVNKKACQIVKYLCERGA